MSVPRRLSAVCLGIVGLFALAAPAEAAVAGKQYGVIVIAFDYSFVYFDLLDFQDDGTGKAGTLVSVYGTGTWTQDRRVWSAEFTHEYLGPVSVKGFDKDLDLLGIGRAAGSWFILGPME